MSIDGWGEPPLVLVLDDLPLSVAAIRADLRAGYTIVEARDAQRGLDILDATPRIVGVVAHLNLARGQGGAAFMVDVARVAPWCARVLLSDSPHAEQFARDFAHGFVRRPWPPGMLSRSLARIIADRSQPHRTHRPRVTND